MTHRVPLFVLTLVVGLSVDPATRAWAQEDERYDFDGVADTDPQPDDPTDWMTSVNWSDGGADPFPPFGPEIPDFGTRVEIQTSTFGVNAPVIGPGDTAEAFGVRIGRFGGAGLLTMTGGTLDVVDTCTQLPFTCNRRIRVGAASVALPEDRHPGVFDISGGVVTTDTFWIGSGSQGTVNMTGGEIHTRSSFYFDWTFDASSVLNMTDGLIDIGSDLRMFRTSHLNLDGGQILVGDDLELGTDNGLNVDNMQTPNITLNMSGGLLEGADLLQIGGSLVVEGGILRAGSFDDAGSTGTIEVNAAGIIQFADETIAEVMSFVDAGWFTTSDPGGVGGFQISTVDVEGTPFTQLSLASAGSNGDFDDDGDRDGADLILWQRQFGDTLTADDLATWQESFGVPVGALAATPEPAAALLCSIGFVALAMRRPTAGSRKPE